MRKIICDICGDNIAGSGLITIRYIMEFEKHVCSEKCGIMLLKKHMVDEEAERIRKRMDNKEEMK